MWKSGALTSVIGLWRVWKWWFLLFRIGTKQSRVEWYVYIVFSQFWEIREKIIVSVNSNSNDDVNILVRYRYLEKQKKFCNILIQAIYPPFIQLKRLKTFALKIISKLWFEPIDNSIFEKICTADAHHLTVYTEYGAKGSKLAHVLVILANCALIFKVLFTCWRHSVQQSESFPCNWRY